MKVLKLNLSLSPEATLLAHITDRVKGKEIYIPLNNDAMANGDMGAINLLTNSDVDKYTDTPSYKRTVHVWKSFLNVVSHH